MRGWTLALFALTAGALAALNCNKDSDSTGSATTTTFAPGQPVTCGSQTCSGTQYCMAVCTCCGTYSGTGNPPANSYAYACHDLPADCDPNALCECTELLGAAYSCSGGTRTLSSMCY